MEYKEQMHPQKRNKEIEQEITSRNAGDNGMFLEDNRSATPIQKKTIDALEHKSMTAPIQKKENNTGLPDTLKSGIENLSGYAMDDVKVHYNSNKPAQLNAHAYAQGTDIHLGSGQEQHLAHEAWHVVQQKQGRVQPTMQLKSKVNINDDVGLEKEADVMGAKALQFQSKGGTSVLQTVTISKKTTQRYIVPEDEVAGSFTSQVSRDKDGGGRTFLDDTGKEAKFETKEKSKVRVAVSGKMAIEDSDKGARQAKFFYADGDILAQANAAMESIESPISFDMGSAKITVRDENGFEHVLDLIVPIKNEGAEDQATGTNIRIPENCNEAACAITKLGGSQNMFKGKFNSGENAIDPLLGTLGHDLLARTASFLPAYLKDKKASEDSSADDEHILEPSEEQIMMDTARSLSIESRDKIIGYDKSAGGLDPDMPDRIAQHYSEDFLMQPGSKEVIDQLGINESAAPDAGDAMAIFSIGKGMTNDGVQSMMDYRTGNPIENFAPYHFATVIARSGADYITMENYVRQKEEADDHDPEALDPRYFFRMYGPEAQSFHSENESRYPNAMTLALSKPIQQVAQLQSDAPIQFSDEEDTVDEVRDLMTDGPGNQTTSSKKAKESFDLASQLEDLLLITKNSKNNKTEENRGLDGLGGDALYRKNEMKDYDYLTVPHYVGFMNGGKERAEQLDKAKKLKNLTEIVWRNFVLQKTGGGSCDHISAVTYMNLADKGKKPVLVSYEPKPDKEYKVTPPSEEYNKHRSVLLLEEQKDKEPLRKEVDPWFPDNGRVQIFESEKDASSKLKNVKIKWQWTPDDQEFIDAVEKELEVRYKEFGGDEKLKELTGKPENVKYLWKIESKKKDEEK
ncbi:DUF4157 domain-containing protein [Dokdonia sp.]|uniref:eCIS core domain-containing protein n=1 Tax=Dokdonia sp. TaxID=2024995 RepID=UPI003263A0AE